MKKARRMETPKLPHVPAVNSLDACIDCSNNRENGSSVSMRRIPRNLLTARRER